jgi:hypothetical protein
MGVIASTERMCEENAGLKEITKKNIILEA